MITGRQCRAARALLNWSQADLAKACGLSKTAINNFEGDNASIKQSSADSIIGAFTQNNIELTANEGVQFRKDHVRIIRGEDVLVPLWDDIIETMKDSGGEILITNVNEKETAKRYGNKLQGHIEKLQEIGITERLLSCEGDQNFFAPKEWYRWLSKDVFNFGMSMHIYDNKVAFFLWKETMVLLVDSPDAAKAEKERFDALWNSAKIP